MHSMKKVEFWYWRMKSDTTGKVIKSPCRFRKEDALARDPQAAPIPGSCVVIEVADTPDEIAARAPTNRNFR